jgi:hypothetical protein
MSKKLSLLLCCAAITFCISCKFEDRDDLPSIFQENMEISEESPETYFMVGPRDYDMGWIRISTIDEKQSENVIDKDIAITKEITNKEETEIEISEDEKAIIYCEKGKIKKIVFNSITVEKTGNGKYSVKFNKKPSTQKIFIYAFAFANSDGVSSAKIYLNKKGL